MRRTAIQIRKEILKLLKQNKEISLRRLESKINTHFETIKRQIKDLESLGFIILKQYLAHPRNKKPYQTCKITEEGLNWIKKQNGGLKSCGHIVCYAEIYF